MGNSPFRDASAAIERAEILERENAELKDEIERLRNGTSEAEKARAQDDLVRKLTRERDALKIELDKMRYSAPAVLDSVTRKLREERDELREALSKVGSDERMVDALRAKLEAAQDAMLAADRDIGRLEKERDDALAKIELLKEQMPPSDDNRGAVLQRATQERDELLARVGELEAKLASTTKRKR